MSDDTRSQTQGDAAPDASVAGPAETQQLSDAEQRHLWQEGLVQEALDNRPEVRVILGEKLGFEGSRSRGYDRGFEDAARTLTPAQLQGIQTLKDRRMTRYLREELPRDLQAYLAKEATGMDEGGFLAGYVDGVGDFLTALRRRLHGPASE